MNGPGTADSSSGYLAEDDVLLAARPRAGAAGLRPGRRPARGRAALPGRGDRAPGRWWRSAPAPGSAALWLLRGMRPDGVLTSIDVDPEHQRAARAAFTAAGYRRRRGCG